MSEKEKDFEEKEEITAEESAAEKEEATVEEVTSEDTAAEETVAEDDEEKEESFEDIFSSLREKYKLDPLSTDGKPVEKEEAKVFYNPEEDKEMDEFFKEREEGYTALYEEVDAKIAGVDDEVLQKEAEVFNLEFKKENKPVIETPAQQEFEDVFSQSDDFAEDDAEDEVPVAAIPVAENPVTDSPAEVNPVVSAPVAAPAENDAEIAEEIVADDAEKAPAGKDKKNKNKKGGAGEVIRKIIFIISIIALLGSVAWLVNDYFIQPYLINKENKEIENILIQTTDADPEEVIEKLNSLDADEKEATFASLKEINPDFKAWIVMPGADISLAVVQGNNNDKYLNTGFKGKWSSGGTAFIDHRNKEPFFDTNTTIYGHNMRDGSMFGNIKNYKDKETFKDDPYIYIYTENENYVYKIYSVFLTNAKKSSDNDYVFYYTFDNLSTEECFNSYMEEVRIRSYYDTGVDYQAGDKLLTLSTCDRTVIKDGRLVVVARLVRENEDMSIDESLIKDNNNQKFPQIYYDKKKTNNPYESDKKWEPQ